MNLADLYQRPRATVVAHRADSLFKQFAIALDIGVRVVRGDAQVQRLAAVTGGYAAGSRAETMNQPGNAREYFSVQYFDDIRSAAVLRASCSCGSRHTAILATIVSRCCSTTSPTARDSTEAKRSNAPLCCAASPRPRAPAWITSNFARKISTPPTWSYWRERYCGASERTRTPPGCWSTRELR